MTANFALKHNQKISINDQYNQQSRQHQVETAVYLADMILDLRNMAKHSELNSLQGLLEIAYYEAFSAANRINIPADEYQHLKDISQDAKKASAVI